MTTPPLAAVIFDDPEPLNSFAFCRALFPDRGYVEGPAGAAGWRTIASRQTRANRRWRYATPCARRPAPGLATFYRQLRHQPGAAAAARDAVLPRRLDRDRRPRRNDRGAEGLGQDHHRDGAGGARARLPGRRDGGRASDHEGHAAVPPRGLGAPGAARAPGGRALGAVPVSCGKCSRTAASARSSI